MVSQRDVRRLEAGRGASRSVDIQVMRYRALGPITVELDGHEAKLGGLRQQMVLESERPCARNS